MREIVVDVMSAVLFSALTVVVLFLAKKAGMLISTKMRDIEQRLLADQREKEANLFAKARETLEHIVYISVAAMEQLSAKELREKVKLGLEKPEKLHGLAMDVLENVKNTISPDLKESLNRYIVDLDEYIAAQIEESLTQIKSYSAWLPATQTKSEELETKEGEREEKSEVN